MSFFEILHLLGNNVVIYLGSFILILSLLVFIHEWGHYIVARLCGVKVEEFSIGFGKEIGGRTDKNGTRWKFCLIPLGGYVKLFGDTDPASAGHQETLKKEGGEVRSMTQAERDVAFFAKPVWQRAAVVFAGPAINYIFAFIVLSLLFAFNGQPVTPPSAAAVIGGSSADISGFKPHDLIVSVDGKKIQTFEDIRREMMIGLDEQKHFVVEREDKIIDIYAKPAKVEDEDHMGFKQSRGLLGLISPRHAIDIGNIISIDGEVFWDPSKDQPEEKGNSEEKNAELIDKIIPEERDLTPVREALQKKLGQDFKIEIKSGQKTDILTVKPLLESNKSLSDPESADYNLLFLSDISSNAFVKYPLHIAALKALEECWHASTGTLQALWQIVSGTRSAAELGGVIRIGALAGDMAKQGFVAMILFAAMLSINLGLINLLPIPLLDGGHLTFYAFEALRGKPVPEQIQEYAFRFGLVFLVGVMVFANLNDLIQLFL